MTGIIKVYPSMLDGEPIETHSHEGTIGEWLCANVEGYSKTASHPIAVFSHGKRIYEWDDVLAEDVSIKILPQGGRVGQILSIVFPVISFPIVAIRALIPQMPALQAQKQGKTIDSSSIRANQVKLNEAIPEIAGRFRRFPDYLMPPHKYFEDKRSQWIELFMCVGKGKHQILGSQIMVGDTALIDFGANAEFEVFQPGEDVSANPSAQWWHSVPEVGNTTTGNAGLHLRATFNIPSNPNASSYEFDGFDINIPTGAGEYPDEWSAGLIVRVTQYLDYTVLPGGVISGPYVDQLQAFVGMLIEIVGPNEGFYKVSAIDTSGDITLSYDDGSPVSGFIEGAQRMAIGYRGLLYQTTAASDSSITVERLTDDGSTDAGWGGFDLVTTNDAVLELDPSNIEGDWTGPFAACPEGEVTDTIEWDVMFPGGIIGISGSGDYVISQVTVEVQWRDIDIGGAWNSQVKQYIDGTVDQIGFTETINLGSSFRPEIRMRRVGGEPNHPTVKNRAEWYGLRAKMQSPSSYEGVTTLAVKIKGGSRLSGQSENQINCIATRVLPVRTGGVWSVESPTRSITSFVAHVAKSLGYTDDQLDLDKFDELEAIWDDRDDFYDWVHEESTARDIMNKALQAGMATLTIDNGIISPVRDQIRTGFDHMYTPQNMTKGLQRSSDLQKPDDADGIDVEYIDSVTWTQNVVQCRLPGDLGLKVDKIKVDGVTNRDRAWRIGMRARREARYRRWSYAFSTELDALNSKYLSYAALADDVPGYGKSCILQSIVGTSQGALMYVSEPLDWDTSSLHIVALRNPDGTLNGPYVATPGPDAYSLYADVDLPYPEISREFEPPHVLFGTQERWVFPSLITSIRTNGFESVNVQAVNYDARVYADDDNSAP